MDERKEVLIVCLILLLIGVAGFFITLLLYIDFNFNKSELYIKDNIINEKLNYHTNKAYHTLYRTFSSTMIVDKALFQDSFISKDGYVEIFSVDCSEGKPYAKDIFYCYSFPGRVIETSCPYTEPNEYGCTFGNTYGFREGQDYRLESTYTVNPRSLFKINNNYYIKFVAYSKGNHKLLIKGSSLIISEEAVSQNYYFPKQDVIIYLPYTPENLADYKILEREDFEFDSPHIFSSLFFFFIPVVFFYVLWFFTGRELVVTDFPPEMSFYPRERKGWEVAAFFNPPFSVADNNFFAAAMLDFYRRKIISTKMIDKDVYIKINKTEDLDAVEEKLIEMLMLVKENCSEKHRDGEYFNLKKAMSSFSLIWTRHILTKLAKELQKEIKKEGKDYLSRTGLIVTTVLFIILAFSGQIFFLLSPVYFTFIIVSFLIIFLTGRSSSIFIKFKGEYYKEYEHWQAFKNFLKKSSLKLHGHKGVVMWEQYLVYASALGVAKKVLKELKAERLITEEQYHLYMGTHTMAHSFAASSGAGGHGGVGGGGVGGGGVGGGGGGGR